MIKTRKMKHLVSGEYGATKSLNRQRASNHALQQNPGKKSGKPGHLCFNQT